MNCRHCGAEISEWAARCPVCRRDTGETTAVPAGLSTSPLTGPRPPAAPGGGVEGPHHLEHGPELGPEPEPDRELEREPDPDSAVARLRSLAASLPALEEPERGDADFAATLKSPPPPEQVSPRELDWQRRVPPREGSPEGAPERPRGFQGAGTSVPGGFERPPTSPWAATATPTIEHAPPAAAGGGTRPSEAPPAATSPEGASQQEAFWRRPPVAPRETAAPPRGAASQPPSGVDPRPPARDVADPGVGKKRIPPALVLIGVALVLLVITLLVSQGKPQTRATTVLGTQNTQPPSPSAAPSHSDLLGRTLVYADAGKGLTVMPFGGTPHTFENYLAPGYPERPIRAGDAVAFLMNGTAYALGPPFAATPKAIGPADHLFPSLTAGAVGVYRAGVSGTPPTIQVVAVRAGAVTGTVFPIDPASRPVAEVRSGVLMWDTSGVLRVWSPETGDSGRYGDPLGNASAILGTSADRVAWASSTGCTPAGECLLHITDLATGRDAVVDPPPGYGGYLAAGAFSPVDGGLFAAFVFEPIKGNGATARLVLVGLNSAKKWVPTIVPQAQVPLGRPVPAAAVWTQEGSRLLFSGGSGLIHDYRVGARSAFPTEQAASFSFTILG